MNIERLAPPVDVDLIVDPAVAFTLKLGRALHRYGTPAHRLEEMLSLVTERLGGSGYFFSTPTGIFASFGSPEEMRTSLVRVDPGEVDLAKMAALDDLATRVIAGTTSPRDGALEVDAIVASPSQYGPVLTALCFGIVSGAASCILGGGMHEAAAASIVGLVLGSMAIASKRWSPGIFEPVAAITASALAVLLAQLLIPLSVTITTLAGLITLLPGLSLTTAIREIATRNLVSGTARLTAALLLLLELAFGVALGNQIYRLLPPVQLNAAAHQFPSWVEMPAVVLAALGLTVLFRASARDVVWTVMGGVVAVLASRLGAFLLGPEYGAFVGALLLGSTCNLFARVSERPSFIPLLPGLVLLVPGSVGFVSLTHFLERDVVTGVETAFKTMLVAVALVTGMLLANVVAPPRRIL